jgi:hypothetical protein
VAGLAATEKNFHIAELAYGELLEVSLYKHRINIKNRLKKYYS